MHFDDGDVMDTAGDYFLMTAEEYLRMSLGICICVSSHIVCVGLWRYCKMHCKGSQGVWNGDRGLWENKYDRKSDQVLEGINEYTTNLPKA